MIKRRRLSYPAVARMASIPILMAAMWATLVYVLYAIVHLEFLRVPFLPIATVGTAVAFYVGFKNNASYDRFWEGRKIWGGVVNTSRTWATMVLSYVDVDDNSPKAQETRKRLIYRHLAWINALRLQLRKNSRFFDKPAPQTARRLLKHADAMRNDWDKELAPFLDPDELTELSARANTATHLLTRQGTELSKIQTEDRVSIFHQIELMKAIEEMYTLQGKCERIKNTPFPRQYAEFSRLFTRVFVLLIPFGMLDVFAAQISNVTNLKEQFMVVIPMILASALVTWVFFTMEAIGDASEDPFERSMNDVPMNALCRTIEIDLRELLGETDLPEKEPIVDGLLY